ncbi:DnaD domain protein [Lysinibacillus sphaericus]|uniref:DnaD domain protein n=1 Tax=Lysinibacillus sphaericus TaxID=1421 RepID=UPI000C17C2CB|nr:DnaD domain protein [Lysinibacillus sphaericus]PIJ99200.1 replication protein [Lysinibacillus sphaericus]
MIYRVVKNDNFVVLDKGFLNNDQLSWKAKGLLAYMLSLPDDWDFCLTDLATRSKCGRDGTASIVNELIREGYLQKVQERAKDGKFSKVEFVVFEVSNRAAQPSTGYPSTAAPQTEKPTQLNNKLLNNQLLNNKDDNQQSQTAYYFFEQQGFGSLSAYMTAKIHSWLNIFSEEIVIHAMKLAVEHNVLCWRYVEKILQNWHHKQLKTMADIASDQMRFHSQKKKVTDMPAKRRQEIIPQWFHHRHEEERPQQPAINFEAERQKILALLESG